VSFKVRDLRNAIANAADDADVMLIHEGMLRPAVGIAVAPNGEVAVIRGLGNTRHAKKFSIAEDGIVGGLTAKGMSDQSIAELLERTVDSVKRRKKSLGLS